MKGKVPISDARHIGTTRSCPFVVIFAIEDSGNRYTITTWGKSKLLCKLAALWGDQLHEAVQNGTMESPEFEPNGPDHPVSSSLEQRKELT